MHQLVIQSLLETLIMVVTAMGLGTLIGGSLAFILSLTKPSGLRPKPWIFYPLSFVINAFRSIPFIILIILMIPTTRWCLGSAIGTAAATLPLTFGASLIIARLIEDALETVPAGLLDVGKAMGASPFQIMIRIQLSEALPLIVANLTNVTINVIGFSAMAGTVGGGGLGDLAIRYGYQRYNVTLLLIIVLILMLFVQGVQMMGDRLSTALKKG